MSALPCEGCHKPVEWDEEDDKPKNGCWIDGLYPGKERHLLHNGRYRDKPSDTCLAKLRGDLKRCIGCGNEKVYERSEKYGFLCKMCRGHLTRAQETPEVAGLRWYMIDTYGMSQDDRGYREDNDAFGKLLVQAAARDGRVGHAGDAWDSGGYKVLSTNKRNDAHSGMPAVELTEAQAEAVLELMRWMRKTLDANYRAGVENGHNLLVRLARGEVGPSDYEAQKARDLKEE